MLHCNQAKDGLFTNLTVTSTSSRLWTNLLSLHQHHHHLREPLQLFFIYLQLIIFMALAAGHSSIKCGPLTTHTQTAIHVAEKIMKVSIYNVGRFLI